MLNRTEDKMKKKKVLTGEKEKLVDKYTECPATDLEKALRTRPETAAVCGRTLAAYCGPIKRSQLIRFKTEPIKAKFNGGENVRDQIFNF